MVTLGLVCLFVSFILLIMGLMAWGAATAKPDNSNTQPPKVNLTLEHRIKRLIDYTPDFYKTQRPFLNCIEYMANKEWGLVIDSLIELADKSGHYFSEDFWLELASSADELNLTDKANHCRNQIERNACEIKNKTPFGWTTIKLDDSNFQHHISEQLKEDWATERREKDKVAALITKDGVHFKSHGRSGFIYIVAQGKIAEVDFELGMAGLILYFNGLTSWSLPIKQPLTPDEKQKIKSDVINWATITKHTIEFDD